MDAQTLELLRFHSFDKCDLHLMNIDGDSHFYSLIRDDGNDQLTTDERPVYLMDIVVRSMSPSEGYISIVPIEEEINDLLDELETEWWIESISAEAFNNMIGPKIYNMLIPFVNEKRSAVTKLMKAFVEDDANGILLWMEEQNS